MMFAAPRSVGEQTHDPIDLFVLFVSGVVCQVTGVLGALLELQKPLQSFGLLAAR